jgi:SOS-response transcriptional repressor LexA
MQKSKAIWRPMSFIGDTVVVDGADTVTAGEGVVEFV